MLIDVSNYQGTINWASAGGSIDGAYIKVTEGTGFVDRFWRQNHDGVIGAGKLVGAYHFADLGDPVAEANHFADQYLSVSGWGLSPVLDIESSGSNAGWVIAFRNQFRARTGQQGFRVYSSLSFFQGALDPAGFLDPETDLWVAAYRSQLGWNHPSLVLWQNTSSGTTPGVLGSVDQDQYMNGWTPGGDMGLAPDERDALFSVLEQLTGSRTPGQYPGYQSFVAGSTVKATLTDFIRNIDAATWKNNHLMFEGSSQSRIPGDTNKTDGLNAILDTVARVTELLSQFTNFESLYTKTESELSTAVGQVATQHGVDPTTLQEAVLSAFRGALQSLATANATPTPTPSTPSPATGV